MALVSRLPLKPVRVSYRSISSNFKSDASSSALSTSLQRQLLIYSLLVWERHRVEIDGATLTLSVRQLADLGKFERLDAFATNPNFAERTHLDDGDVVARINRSRLRFRLRSLQGVTRRRVRHLLLRLDLHAVRRNVANDNFGFRSFGRTSGDPHSTVRVRFKVWVSAGKAQEDNSADREASDEGNSAPCSRRQNVGVKSLLFRPPEPHERCPNSYPRRLFLVAHTHAAQIVMIH